MDIEERSLSNQTGKWIAGIAFTFFIALLGYVLAMVPGFDHVGQLACAIIIAVVYRQFFGYPRSNSKGNYFLFEKTITSGHYIIWS